MVNVNYFGLAESVHVLLGDSSGFLQNPSTYLIGGYDPTFYSVAAADLDADGDTDLVTAGYGTVLLGDGTGSFTVAGHYDTGGDPCAVVLGDFTGDGRIDLATANGDSLSVRHGGGDGTFSSPVNSAVHSVVVACGRLQRRRLARCRYGRWRGRRCADQRPVLAAASSDRHHQRSEQRLRRQHRQRRRHLHADPLARLRRGCDRPLRHGGRHRRSRQRLHGRVRHRDHPGRPDQRDGHGRGPGRPPPRGAERDLRRQPQRRDQCDHRRRSRRGHHRRRRAVDQHQRREQAGGQRRTKRRSSRSQSRSRSPTISR